MSYDSEKNEGCISRLSDKYQGVRMCEMNKEELEEFLGKIAQRGAADALKAIGLADDYAVNDIRDLRDILKGFRVMRKSALTTALATFGRILGWAIILLLAGFFLHTSPTMKKTVVDLMAP